MLKKILISTVAVVALGQNLNADDYHLYGEWTPGNLTNYFGATGFVDNNGLLGGDNGDQYIFFTAGPGGDWSSKGYIYKVEVNGDPNAHPDVNGQPTADRVFTYVSEHELSNGRGHAGEFYVDNTGIYYGSGQNIKKWDFDWTNETDIISNGNISTETLAYNKTTGEWWTATRSSRYVYRYNNSTNQWEYQFSYPNLAGSHHDGMEIVNNKIYISDMTTDKIIVYELNATGGVSDTSAYNIYDYSANPDVEGMGFGPNQHFWIAGYRPSNIYEIGEGSLATSCSQTFNYTTNWTMQRSKCDNMKVPGFDDTIMAKMEDGKLIYATADAGAKAWLEGLSCDVTVVDELTLNTGDGVWLVGKNDISKTIASGENRNNYVNFVNGAYTFIGFNIPIDLNDKFGTQPVENIYYYNGGWNTWTPADGNQTVLANQGLYILPNGDFSLLIK